MVQTQIHHLSHLLKQVEKTAKQAAIDMDAAVSRVSDVSKRNELQRLTTELKAAKSQDEANGIVEQIKTILCP
jgi:hypothetical protein